MRRFPLILVLLAFVATGCGDDADGATDGGSTTSVPVTSTTTTPTTTALPTTTRPTTTTSTTTTTTTSVLPGMCGELIPVVTEFGTNCVDPGAAADGPAGFPDLVVVEDDDLTIYSYDDQMLAFASSFSTRLRASAVHHASSGVTFTREHEVVNETEHRVAVVRYDPDGTRTELGALVEIYDVAVIDGIETVIGAVESPDGYGFGGVKALAIDDGREIADFGLRAEAEFGVTDFMWSEAAGIGVASAWSDLTEWIGFVDRAGTVVELPSPTDDLDYNSPPYVTAATISLDGSTLYWVEGPDWGFDPETNESGPVAAPWVLRSAALRSGEARLYWPLSEEVLDSTVLNIESIEDLGGWILVNRSVLRGTESVALAPLVLDLTTEEPEMFAFPAVGPATLAAG